MVDRRRLLSDRTDLRATERDHLRALVADWTLISDLAFADLVLWVPTWNRAGFTAVAQVRPATGSTAVPEDMIGRFVAKGRKTLLDRAFAAGEIIRSESVRTGSLEASEAIPVMLDGRVIAVIARYESRRDGHHGALEDAYLASADDLIHMVATGGFPQPEALSLTDSPPRVGDGLMRLDRHGIVTVASPNAISAFHRLGLVADVLGTSLAATATRLSHTPGPVDEALGLVAGGRAPGSAQVENPEAAVVLRGIPITRDGEFTGALVLVRDVTDLRRQERALLTKDSTIREIHHRVKNNLQTVAALLRLQQRRISEPEGRAALGEAVRRVGAIAVVHETLSMQPGEDVNFDEIADRVIALTRDLAIDTSVARVGTAGTLPSQIVTPLAMVVAELLSNAVQHGFETETQTETATDTEEPRAVTLRLVRIGRRLTVEVNDNGTGLPPDFDPNGEVGLGLQIVKTLVTEELSGAVTWETRRPRGTRVVVDLLIDSTSSAAFPR